MSKWRRRLTITAAVVVGVLLLAILLVPRLVPAEKWKRLAIDRIQAQTGLVVSAGEAGLSLWPLGLRVDEVTVSDPEGRTGMRDLRAEAQDLVVTARIGPLLRGKIHVDEVILRRPEIELTLPDSESGGETDGGAAATGGSSSSSAGASAVLGLFSVEDGRILVHDATGGTLEIRELGNRASLTMEAGDVQGSFSGQLGELVLPAQEPAEPMVLRDLRWSGRFEAQEQGRRGRVDVEEVALSGLESSGVLNWDQEEKSLRSRWTLRGELPALFHDFVRPRLVLPEGLAAEDVDLRSGVVEGDLRWSSTFDASVEDMAAAAAGTLRVLPTEVELLGDESFGRVSGELRIAEGRVQLRLDEVRAPGTRGRLELEGDLLARQPFVLDGSFEVSVAEPRDWAARHWSRLAALAGEDATGPGEWPGVEGRLVAQLQARIDPSAPPEATLPVDWVLSPRRLALLPATMTDSLVVTAGRVSGDLEGARVEGLRLRGPGLEGEATLELAGLSADGRITGTVRLAELDLDALQAAQKSVETAALGESRSPWPWSVRVAHALEGEATLPAPPPGLSADVDLRADRVRSAGWNLQSVQGPLRLENQKLEMPATTAQMGTGRLALDAAMDWTTDPPQWTTRTQAQKIPASELLGPVAAPLARALQAELSGEVRLGGPYRTEVSALIAGLSGDLQLESEGGRVETTSLLGGRVAEFLGQRAADWKELQFRALDAGLSVQGGRVHFDRFLIEGQTRVRASGSVGLDGQADYRLDVLLPPGSTPDLGSLGPVADLLRDESGRFAFGVNVRGSAAKPEVEVDFADLRERARKAGEEAARDEVKDTLDDLGSKLQDELKGKTDEKVEDAVGGLLDRLRKGKKKDEEGQKEGGETEEGGGGG